MKRCLDLDLKDDCDANRAAFTPDRQFGSGASAVEGREALKGMINDFRRRYLEFLDKARARLEAYWMTVFAAAGPNTPLRVVAAGQRSG